MTGIAEEELGLAHAWESKGAGGPGRCRDAHRDHRMALGGQRGRLMDSACLGAPTWGAGDQPHCIHCR